jgi:hypothetical protein
MPSRTVEEFSERIRRCSTADELFAVFRKDVEAEGFQNIAFSQLGTDEGFEIPYLNVPDGTASVYFAENFAEHDPVLAIVPQTTSPFSWAEAPKFLELSRQARNVMESCRELGVHSGITIPMHGPGRRCDLFSLSLRDKLSIDPASVPIVAMKSYATWVRYYEIDGIQQFNGLQEIAGDGAAAPHESLSTPHRDGSARITKEECQALVITDIAHRRYRAGLTDLNDNLTTVLGVEMFDRLQNRGLIFDEPDDMRWRYFARPSPIARSHLRTCGHVPSMRERIWQLHVRLDERPSQ